jgi:hypothetical protein
MISIFFCRARIKASEVVASTTSGGMVGMDGDGGADEILGFADVTVDGIIGRQGAGGLLDLPKLEKTFEMTLSNLDILSVI